MSQRDIEEARVETLGVEATGHGVIHKVYCSLRTEDKPPGGRSVRARDAVG